MCMFVFTAAKRIRISRSHVIYICIRCSKVHQHLKGSCVCMHDSMYTDILWNTRNYKLTSLPI